LALKATFQIINGPMLGTKFSIDEDMEIVIGRGSDCQMQISRDYDPKISRHHCKVKINLPKVIILDLDSTNGTYINDVKVSAEESIVESGSTIMVGDTYLKVLIVEPVMCLDCHCSLPANDLNRYFREGCVYLCDECYEKVSGDSLENRAQIKRTVFCSCCGEKFVDIVPRNRRSPYVCRQCSAKSLVPNMLKTQKIGGRHMVGMEQFEIIKKVGQGGMGSVYQARNRDDGSIIALKIMLPSVAQSTALREDFVREMEHTRILFHPNIVRLIHTNRKESDDLFFTMEYCEAGNIYDLISSRSECMEVTEAFEIMEPCLDALEYAHEIEIHNIELNDGRVASARGLVHRDIKPSNIFLTQKEEFLIPKIADFGLAKAYELAGVTGNTMVGVIAGSLGYIPRQQVRDFKFCKPEVDIWAMAATLYFMLTKRTPRDFRKNVDEVTTVLETPVVPIRDRRKSIPQAVADVIDLALVDSQDLYFKTAREFSEALKTAIQKSSDNLRIETESQAMRRRSEKGTVRITKNKVQ